MKDTRKLLYLNFMPVFRLKFPSKEYNWALIWFFFMLWCGCCSLYSSDIEPLKDSVLEYIFFKLYC